MRLSHGVETASEVGRVGLEETWPIPRVFLIVLVYAPRRKHSAMDTLQKAAICEVQCPDDIRPDSRLPVVFAPVDVGSPCAAGSVENVGGPNSFELLDDCFATFHPNCCRIHLLVLPLKQGLEVSCNPPIATPDEKAVSLCTVPISWRHDAAFTSMEERGCWGGLRSNLGIVNVN